MPCFIIGFVLMPVKFINEYLTLIAPEKSIVSPMVMIKMVFFLLRSGNCVDSRKVKTARQTPNTEQVKPAKKDVKLNTVFIRPLENVGRLL
jgi:hypothetical protein